MIIWSGLGYIIVVISFCMLLLTETVVETLSGNDNLFQEAWWPIFIAFIVSGILINLIKKYYISNNPTKLERSTLFFVKFLHWDKLLAILGRIISLTKLYE